MSPSGQIRPWYPIGMDGSLSPDSFRAQRMVLTAESGQIRTCWPAHMRASSTRDGNRVGFHRGISVSEVTPQRLRSVPFWD